VEAPGVIYFNDGTGRKYVAARSGAPSFVLFSRPEKK